MPPVHRLYAERSGAEQMTMENPDYKPCPFCGAKESDGKPEYGGPLSASMNTNTYEWSIDCLKCGCCGPRTYSMEDATQKWNERQ